MPLLWTWRSSSAAEVKSSSRPAETNALPVTTASPSVAVSGSITPPHRAAEPSALSSSSMDSATQTLCLCSSAMIWTGVILRQRRMSRNLQSPSCCRNRTNPCAVCMPTCYKNGASTARYSMLSRARNSSTKAVKNPRTGQRNITTPCSSDSMNTAFPVMGISVVCTPWGKAIAATSKAATRSAAFTISAAMTRSMSSRPLSIYRSCFSSTSFSVSGKKSSFADAP